MEYCWSFSDNEMNSVTPVATAACLIYFYALLYEALSSTNPSRFLVIVGCIGFPVIVFLAFTAYVSARRFRLDCTGITIRYPFGHVAHFPWNDFSEIALCKIHYASASTAHRLAIRCVIGEEKRGPRNAIVGKERWSTLEYEVLHYRKIISIYYTKDRYMEFIEKCPHSIGDYRHLADQS